MGDERVRGHEKARRRGEEERERGNGAEEVKRR